MKAGTYETLRLERVGHLATLTLDRPEKLNALSFRLTEEVDAVLDEIAASEDIRVVVLTGAGSGFRSGNDVSNQLAALEGGPSGPSELNISDLAPHIRSLPQPVIAAVNGLAAGAGLSIALASDVRIASQNAAFSCIFVKRSSAPDTGTSYTLPHLVGHGIALEMALSGKVYDASWALDKGLVNSVVPAGRLMEEATALATTIASNPPVCVRTIKQLFYQHEPDLATVVLPRERISSRISIASEDRQEAVHAFLEKRSPIHTGR